MAVGPGLAPHRPGTSGQAGSSTPGSFAVVLCWCLTEPAAGVVQEPCRAWQSGGARKLVVLAWQGLVGLAKRNGAAGERRAAGSVFRSCPKQTKGLEPTSGHPPTCQGKVHCLRLCQPLIQNHLSRQSQNRPSRQSQNDLSRQSQNHLSHQSQNHLSHQSQNLGQLPDHHQFPHWTPLGHPGHQSPLHRSLRIGVRAPSSISLPSCTSLRRAMLRVGSKPKVIMQLMSILGNPSHSPA